MKAIPALKALRRRPLLGAGLVVLAVLAATLPMLFQLEITGGFEGFFLLRGEGRALEIKDDIFVGDEARVILALAFGPIVSLAGSVGREAPAPPFLEYEWNERVGRGFVVNHLTGGDRLLTCFSRYRESNGNVPSGLFVGGALPHRRHLARHAAMDETGMAYFNGREWQHIWCSVNESVFWAPSPGITAYPDQWEYLGSRVLKEGPGELALTSRHRIRLHGMNLRVDRYGFFRAGETYFILASKFTNEGSSPADYYYVYGDEPWVGRFGNSGGDIGWVNGRVHLYEGVVDLESTGYAGMFDMGNCLANEGYDYTRAANFIEWLGPAKPDLVYFSNYAGPPEQATAKVPLSSPFSRALFLQWGPRSLPPGGSETYLMAIGMAGSNPKVNFPRKPPVTLSREQLALIE